MPCIWPCALYLFFKLCICILIVSLFVYALDSMPCSLVPCIPCIYLVYPSKLMALCACIWILPWSLVCDPTPCVPCVCLVCPSLLCVDMHKTLCLASLKCDSITLYPLFMPCIPLWAYGYVYLHMARALYPFVCDHMPCILSVCAVYASEIPSCLYMHKVLYIGPLVCDPLCLVSLMLSFVYPYEPTAVCISIRTMPYILCTWPCALYPLCVPCCASDIVTYVYMHKAICLAFLVCDHISLLSLV